MPIRTRETCFSTTDGVIILVDFGLVGLHHGGREEAIIILLFHVR